MKKRRLLIRLSICLFFLFLYSCEKEDHFENEKKGTTIGDGCLIWKFTVKVMLDKKTYDTHYHSDPNTVQRLLEERFKDVADIYQWPIGKPSFEGEIIFQPVFDSSFVYDESSLGMVNKEGASLRGTYNYVIILDGCLGDYADEAPYKDYSWGGYVRYFDNGLGKADGGTAVYDMLSNYQTARGFAHELGHGRGVPDVYAMEVITNEVNGQPFKPMECMMFDNWTATTWSEYARFLINRNKNYTLEDNEFHPLSNPDFPNNIVFKVTKNGTPLDDATINVYKSGIYGYKITKEVYHTGKLVNGQISFESKKLYTPQANRSELQFGTILIEIVDVNQKYYRFVPAYEVQIAYLKGEFGNYTIDIEI